MNPLELAADAWGWWLALPVLAASISAVTVIWAKAVRPIVTGISILIEYAEYLQNEVNGSEDSLKTRLHGLDDRLSGLDLGQTKITTGMASISERVDLLTQQVDGMDTTWSTWLFTHTREHAEIWAILARMGYEQRHDAPVYPPRSEPGDH